MNSGERIPSGPTAQPAGLTFKSLGLIAGSAVIGSVVTLLFMRAAEGGTETFSTIGLLGFFFMTVLAVSATALAVAAIILSRTAERTLNRQSEEIRKTQGRMAAQAEKTAERLEESALLVGEEIVQAFCERFDAFGRDLRTELPARETIRTDVSEAVERAPGSVRFSSAEEIVATEDPEEIEEEKPVPVGTVDDKEPEAQPHEFHSTEDVERAEKKYGEFKDIVLRGVANYPGVVVRKIGEGHYRTEGDELVDGAFTINRESVAVCAFATSGILESRFLGNGGESFSGFLRSLLEELRRRHFTRAFFVFDSALPDDSAYAKVLNKFRSGVDAVTFAQLELFEGSPESIIPELTERVSQLMALESEEKDTVPELSFRRQMAAGGFGN
jgi:hypothetical protein